jgi:hypothetical protein
MHRADVDDLDAFGDAQIHLGHERERLVGRCRQKRLDSPAQLGHVAIGAEARELPGVRGLRPLVGNGDRREPVGAVGRSMLELEQAGVREEHVDDDALRRRQQHFLDELLVLVVAGVGADQLQLRARQGDVEDARVRRVGEVEANDLAASRLELQVRLPRDEHHVAEAAHRDVRRLLAEGRDPSLLDQDVVDRERQLAVGRRPVLRLARGDEDVPVEAQLLAVVLADVRVVPVDARVGDVHPVGERLPHRDRRLRVVRAVVAVLEPQAVPVHGRLEVSPVGDVDGDRRSLPQLQRRAGNRSVVGQHPHRRVADPFLDGDDLERELVAVGELDELGAACVG